MKIRKLYKFESAHIVRDAISRRCSHSFHGHSGEVEVFLKSNHLDKAGMVYDFGAMKELIGSFLDMFDHSVHLWEDEKPHIIEFFKQENERWVILPCNPTAENYALLFKDIINELLSQSEYTNGEGDVYCSGVRYHETRTGWAESDDNDMSSYSLKDLKFSTRTLGEASPKLIDYILGVNSIKVDLESGEIPMIKVKVKK